MYVSFTMASIVPYFSFFLCDSWYYIFFKSFLLPQSLEILHWSDFPPLNKMIPLSLWCVRVLSSFMRMQPVVSFSLRMSLGDVLAFPAIHLSGCSSDILCWVVCYALSPVSAACRVFSSSFLTYRSVVSIWPSWCLCDSAILFPTGLNPDAPSFPLLLCLSSGTAHIPLPLFLSFWYHFNLGPCCQGSRGTFKTFPSESCQSLVTKYMSQNLIKWQKHWILELALAVMVTPLGAILCV